MTDKYTGAIGPTNAMDASDPRFHEAYTKATDTMWKAIVEFELTTGRVVDSIELQNVDVTTFASKTPESMRVTQLHFLPKPGEVSW